MFPIENLFVNNIIDIPFSRKRHILVSVIIMSDTTPKQLHHPELLEEYKVTIGYFDERMYYIDCPPQLSEDDREVVNNLIFDNQGVGIIIGHFDDNLTMKMVSGPAGRVLGYVDPSDFLADNGNCLINLVASKKEQDILRNHLLHPSEEIWGFTLIGKDKNPISVRISNVTRTNEQGEKIWYLSLRRFVEYQYDSVTGGLNRHGFIRYIEKLKQSGASLMECAILFTNIKGFKGINDLYGAAAGDRFLMDVYHFLATSQLNPLVCARMESDKFLLLVKKENLNLETLSSVLSLSFRAGDKNHNVDGVCGIYYIENEDMETSSMIDCAKIAKQHIQDIFVSPYAVFHPDMKDSYVEKINAIARFEEALDQNEFMVYYQPIVDCKTEYPVSCEALVRWKSDKNGIIPPNAFIPALESNGRIVILDQYVYRKVGTFLQNRANQGKPILPVSVNFSRMDFFDEKRIDALYQRLERDSLARDYIHIEVTETSHHTIRHAQTEFIRRINELGGMVYVDDFGTSNASLDMLIEYDFSVLKLDMQFVRGMLHNPKIRSLIQSTIAMAHGLDLKVIAEGVETKEQVSLLRVYGCDYLQGYYFSKPLPQDEFEAYLHDHLPE